ncbi:MAG: hypothetical protein MUC38_03710 [Cyclobacteriaceae bacterium]|jgi:hypothetical protein|nr:hypothetical protein [Cyclobacteriaceae bacterium]
MIENISTIVKVIVNDPYYWVPSIAIVLCLFLMSGRYIYLSRGTDSIIVKTDSLKPSKPISLTDSVDEVAQTDEMRRTPIKKESTLSKEKGELDLTEVASGVKMTVMEDNIEPVNSLILNKNLELIKKTVFGLKLSKETFEILVRCGADQLIQDVEIRFLHQPSFVFYIKSRGRENYNDLIVSYTTYPDFIRKDVAMVFTISEIQQSILYWIDNDLNLYLTENNLEKIKIDFSEPN